MPLQWWYWVGMNWLRIKTSRRFAFSRSTAGTNGSLTVCQRSTCYQITDLFSTSGRIITESIFNNDNYVYYHSWMMKLMVTELLFWNVFDDFFPKVYNKLKLQQIINKQIWISVQIFNSYLYRFASHNINVYYFTHYHHNPSTGEWNQQIAKLNSIIICWMLVAVTDLMITDKRWSTIGLPGYWLAHVWWTEQSLH